MLVDAAFLEFFRASASSPRSGAGRVEVRSCMRIRIDVFHMCPRLVPVAGKFWHFSEDNGQSALCSAKTKRLGLQVLHQFTDFTAAVDAGTGLEYMCACQNSLSCGES